MIEIVKDRLDLGLLTDRPEDFPTLLLYELSIFAVAMVEKKRAEEEARREAEYG